MLFIDISMLFLISFIVRKSTSVDLCDQYNQNPQIKVGLRLGDYTVLSFADQKVYRIANFSYTDQAFTFGQITEITQFWNRKDRIDIGSFPVREVTAFPVNYFKNGTVTKRIVHIIHEKNENLDQLFSYQNLHSSDLTNVIDEERYSLLIYKHKPEPPWSPWYDPLTLVNLMAKFPDTAIHENLKAILAFPLNNPKLPMRLFVYYFEQPTKQQESKPKFKRHVMIGQPVEYEGSNIEMNWIHDKASGRCFERNIEVEAAFALTDYFKTPEQTYTFNIIEFSANHYFVKRVTIIGDKVKPQLENLKIGSIGSIFGCKTNVSDLPPGMHKEKKRVMRYTAVIIVAILLVLVWGVFIGYIWLKLGQLNQGWDQLRQRLTRNATVNTSRPQSQESDEQQRALPPTAALAKERDLSDHDQSDQTSERSDLSSDIMDTRL